jgi:hypothetical protein
MTGVYMLKFFYRKICNIVRKITGTSNIDELRRDIKEIKSALLFSSIIKDCEWLKYRSFSWVGWAMDSTALYTLFCVLNEMKPKNILEFGLGESSKLVHQYCAYYKNCEAVTIEQDEEWVNFFNKRHSIAMNINIHELTITGDNVYLYKDIQKSITGKQFDFIVVDGPFGSSHNSRPQILELIPQNISPTFCIMLDDTNRIGETETYEALCEKLKDNNIGFCSAKYGEGEKSHTVICSADLKFLTSLI